MHGLNDSLGPWQNTTASFFQNNVQPTQIALSTPFNQNSISEVSMEKMAPILRKD